MKKQLDQQINRSMEQGNRLDSGKYGCMTEGKLSKSKVQNVG